MNGIWNAKCACVRRTRRGTTTGDEELSDTSKSDSELEQKRGSVVKVPKTRRRIAFSCSELRRIIPDKILRCFGQDELEMTKLEKTIKASLLIQKWYRRYMARLEVRRRYTWTIFQKLEYAGEQDQVKLYNFFNALLTHIPQAASKGYNSTETSRCSSVENLDLEFEDESPDEEYSTDLEDKKTLRNFSIDPPYTEESVTQLIEIYRKHRHFRLQPRMVADILKKATSTLRKLPNINMASTALTKQITICGDLHGKFDDLLVILHKNGLPSTENPYIFNGDFVDRGKRGLEVFLILLLFVIVFPGGVYLNRGNHEDHIMNQRYGFIREVQTKYRKNSERLLKLIEGVYRWLPLGTIINNKVLVVHGGISDSTDLSVIQGLEREKYVSLLRPPINDSAAPGAEAINKAEWKQVFDILWSDPQDYAGCIPNNLRGAGTYFGPDITKKFLKDHKLSFLVRSHECKPDGYEICHDNLVITIFSASNYYEIGSNNGAYIKLMGTELEPHFVQYMAVAGRKKLTLHQRMGLVESGATRELQAQILNRKEEIEREFAGLDPDRTGYITITQWCVALENVTGLQIPWRLLKDKLVSIDPDTNLVRYETTFDIEEGILNVSFIQKSVQGASTVVETLYRNKSSLEAIFRIIDKDNSGYISLDELADACNLIKEHMPCPMTDDQLEEICKLMDINKDGLVDLNEFMETFRMVDPESKRKNLPNSPDNSVNRSDTKSPRLKNLKRDDFAKDCPNSNEQPKQLSNDGTEKVAEDKKEENTETNEEDLLGEQGEVKSLLSEIKPILINDHIPKMSPVLSSRRGSQI